MSVKTVAASPISKPGLTVISRSSTIRKSWCSGTEKHREGEEKQHSRLQENNNRVLNGISVMWKGMRNIRCYSKKNGQVMDGNVDRANDFNLLFNRFDGGGSAFPVLLKIPVFILPLGV